jgi:chromosome segregation ATPase
MTHKVPVLLLGFVLGSGVAAALSAQPDSSPDLSSEIAKLNKTVREITDLLAKHAEMQKVDLLMKRVELASAAVGRLEDRLRSMKAERTSVEDERHRLEAELAETRAHADTGELDNRRPEVQGFLARGEENLKRLTARVQAIGSDIADAESLLANQREELRQLQRQLDQALGRS